jgi:bacitracin synthase 3
MLNDSSTKILLTQKHLVGKVKFDGETINSEDTSIYGGEGSNVRNLSGPGDLLYVIYTSGTSGRPKGVPIKNKNMVNYMNWFIKAIDLSFDDKSILTSSFAFDLLYTVIFGTILTGGALHVPPRETFLVPGKLLNYTRENKITFMKVTPSLFNLIVNCIDFSLEMCRTLRFIMLGGEMIVVKDVEKAHKVCRHLRVMNHYGPTETTIGSVVQMIDFDKFEEYKINPTIGKPIDNYRVYIVDRYCRLVPVGVCGELCIGGASVGLGYLNRPELTSDRFIKNPYRKGERLYRTGDLAKWRLDGNIKLLGRMDDQVKIRGYRIELEGIKNRLLKHKDIKDAIVIGRQAKNGDKYLCAYIVSDKKLPTSQLREYLSKTLPDHMIPPYFVQLDQIPMAKQNKVDRKMLPAPVLTTEKGYIPPRNAAEKKLVETWEHVLGRTPIGIDENFFINGGDSIKTIQVISRMNKTGYELKMKDIFQHPTIAELAPFVKRFERAADQSVISGTIPLTPIQEEFFTGPGTDRHHYNQTVLFHAKERLEEEGIRRVFHKIQEHHDALRMTFKEMDGEIIQTNHELGYPLSLDVYDFRNREEEDAKEALEGKAGDIQASIDLEKGPLVKVGLFRLVDGDRLLIVSHHLVIDTVSWRILLEDIERLYRRYQKGGPLELPPKTDSFKLWAEKLSNYADSEEFLKEKPYWKKLESTQIPGIEKEFNEEDNYLKDCDTISIDIGEEETDALLTGVNAAFSTGINDILLTALCLAVRETFGIDRLSITLEGHGREEIIPDVDISRTVGWFTSLYPVILEVVPGEDLGRQIKEIKERLRQVPNKGIGCGILKYLTHDEHKKDIVFQLAPQISFNYLGQFDAGPDTMLLGRAKESTGHSRSPDGQRKYRWDILGMVIDNTMEISVTYNKKQYKRETLSRFLAHYKDRLEKITVFCLAREQGEPTPSDFSYKGLSIDTVDRLCRQYPVQDIYALTPTQEGMLFHERYETSSAYFVQVSFRFQGRLSIPLLEKSLNQLFKRYDILRTAFVYEGLDEPVQVVLEERRVDFLYKDIRGIAPGIEKETFIKEFKESDLERSFNLSRDVLLRMAVLRVEDGVYEFTWSNHHLLMDGWCRALLNTELFEIYNGYLQKKPFRLPPVKPYRSYIQWLEKQDKEKARKYWGNLLEGYNGTAVVPRRNVPGTFHEGEGYKREEITFVLDSARTKALNGLATKNRVTLSVIIQTLWGLLLTNYNGKNDVVFGIVVSGRPSEIDGVESMVGLFINTIPVRIRFKETAKFSDLIRQVQEESIKGAAYQYFSLADIQAQTVLKQNLLDHFLTFLNYPIGELNERGIIGKNKEPGSGSMEISHIESVERSNYNLDVIISYDEQLNIRLRYNANIYDDKFMKKLLVHIDEVIAQVIGNNDIELKDISISHGLVVAEPSMEREDHGDFAF